MRVGLNATCFNDRPSGARQRFEGLYGALIRRRPDIEFMIYEPRDCRVARWFGGAPNVHAVTTPLPSAGRLARAMAGLGYWRARLKKDRHDLFETFNLPLVRAPDCPTIFTIHDVRTIGRDVSLLSRLAASVMTKGALRDADAVITVSETMRNELLAIEPRAWITTIHNGIDPVSFADGPDDGNVLQRLGLSRPYLLSVGHIEPRKNYERLVGAMRIVRDSRPDLGLVIVGNDGGSLATLEHRIAAQGMGDAVHLRHNVADPDLRALYRGSTAVVFPSLYEGFGIPILEAMAARRPLITSDLAVFAELTQGGAATFSPHSVEDMAATIAVLLDDPARQAAQVAHGLTRVGDFAFDLLASEIEAVYHHLAERSPGGTA